MKKIILIVLCMVSPLILCAFKKNNENMNNAASAPATSVNIGSSVQTPVLVSTWASTSSLITAAGQNNISSSSIPAADPSDINEYYIIRDGYNKGKKFSISFPQIKGLNSASRQSTINKILKQDAMSYLGDTSDLVSLEIQYEIKWKGNNLLSVEYYGCREISGAPHPYKLSSITNINIGTGDKIKLKNMFHIDQGFIDSIKKNGTYVGPLYPDDPNLIEAVNTNINSTLITPDLPDINFYFTRDAFGIIINVSDAYGGYALIETKYSVLKNYIDTGNIIWKDFDKNQSADSNIPFDNNQNSLADKNSLTDEKTLNDLDEFTEIKNQSFQVYFEMWGKVRFVSGKDYQGNLLFFLTDDKNNIFYQFPDYYVSYKKNQTISAVAFRDINKDGLKDIIIIAAGDARSTSCDIYFQTNYSFVQIPDLYHHLNQSSIKYNTISKVMNYMNKTGNAIVAKFLNVDR